MELKNIGLKEIALKDVKLTGGLLGRKNKLIREEVIPYQWKALNDEIPDADPSHAIENLKIAAGQTEGEFIGMVFQDSDVAKWLEAVAYQLATDPDKDLEELADTVIDLIAEAQEDDGYLNTYFSIKEPGKKWTNLAECHELYCAGHMLEAAVAYYNSTGKKKLLDVMIHFIELIDDKFGPEEGKLKGYPGHQEIELALTKLYKTTGEKKYRALAKFFIDQRGQEPNYFQLEYEERGKTGFWSKSSGIPEWDYFQAHKPVRDQDAAIGHAVRALYMYSGMADVARETGDESLIEACKRLWENTTKKQMYITGGVGSSGYEESFTIDYDLPNDTAYTETCAAIALVFFAQRMFHLEKKAEYMDVMERALYNGVLSGMSEDGKRFFYVNPLEVIPEVVENRNDHIHVKPTRQKWFGCACCPPNVARLLASIGKYIYSYNDNSIFVNLYADNTADCKIRDYNITLNQETNYPWDGKIKLSLDKIDANDNLTVSEGLSTAGNKDKESIGKGLVFTLALRIPGWCRKAVLKINGEEIEQNDLIDNGYIQIERSWQAGDQVELILEMPVERLYANPKVREDIGKVALQRGPLVYCLEEVDNGSNLAAVYLPQDTELSVEYREDLLEGVAVIEGQAVKLEESDWSGKLYSTEGYKYKNIDITAVPYYAWDNRESGEMLVWMNNKE